MCCRSLDWASGYLDTQQSDKDDVFRDGWFYPGGVGVLTSGDLLAIVCRTMEVLNLVGSSFHRT